MHMYLNLSLSLPPPHRHLRDDSERHTCVIYILYDKERVSYTNHANTSLGK